MFKNLPQDATQAVDWTWEEYAPYAQDLLERDLSEANFHEWMLDNSQLIDLIYEAFSRLRLAIDVDTTDEAATQKYMTFLQTIVPEMRRFNFEASKKLVASGFEPDDLAVAMRGIRSEIDLFREANLPLLTQEQELQTEYDKIAGVQTIEWGGEERTLAQLQPVFLEKDRDRRETAFRAMMQRQLDDRTALNDLWVKLFNVRHEIATNADFDNYLDYRWKFMGRFDYTPDDAREFHAAIESVVVPAVKRLHDKRRQQLGYATLRPWDLFVETADHEPLKPFQSGAELEAITENIFTQVHPDLGGHIKTMRDNGLFDLENRKGKSPGGYCMSLNTLKMPFIFMNAVGLHDDVQTMLHEAGHAFHVFESNDLPYSVQRNYPMEFAEVASMSMELLAAPQLSAEGSFYTEAEAARARLEHLEGIITFWPYMAVVDSFQHWAYTNGDAALDPAACDAQWTALWDRYMQGVDYSGLDDFVATGWHRKLHIYQFPFYYIEYGLAQLGAVQVWANSLKDHEAALADYRAALALGGTATLPDLFARAGAKLSFDADTLQQAVDLVESTIGELEAV